MSSDIVISCESVSKKFCRSLKKSLWYGIRDMAAEIAGGSPSHDQLRAGEFWAVNDCSFQLRSGECLGLIGHNGAGKTTLLKMLNGLIKPDHGRIVMRGNIGALIALGAGFNPILTGRENVFINGSVLGMKKAQIEAAFDKIIDFAGLGEFIDAPVQSYSTGMAVRLGFAVAAFMQPNILLLDEVLAVGDMAFQAKCYNTLSSFRAQGTAFVLVSHNMHHIGRYCDRVLYLRHGKVVYIGQAEEGIRLFKQDMAAESGQNMPVNGRTDDACGTGKVLFQSIRFLAEGDREVALLSPTEPFSLVVEFERKASEITDGVLDLIIRDSEGILFQGTSHNYGVDFGDLPQRGRFLLKFGAIPSNSNRLSFAFCLMSRRTGEIYDWRRDVEIRMVNKPQLNGRLSLDIDWHCETSA